MEIDNEKLVDHGLYMSIEMMTSRFRTVACLRVCVSAGLAPQLLSISLIFPGYTSFEVR